MPRSRFRCRLAYRFLGRAWSTRRRRTPQCYRRVVEMKKAAVLIVPFLALAFPSAHAESMTCDKASLAKLETDIAAMSGKEQKRAMAQFTNAKAAFAAGNTKKCERIISKIGEGSSKTTTMAQSAKASIDAANAQFVKEFNGKDAAAAASHYAEDAAAFPPGQARVDGRQNIQKMWQAAMDAGASDLTLTTIDVEESGDLASE